MDSPRLPIRKVEPVGSELRPMFVDRWGPDEEHSGGLELVECHLYPPSPKGKELRDYRERAGVTLGDAARRSGLSVVEWCDIERGRRVPEDWDAAFRVIEEVQRNG